MDINDDAFKGIEAMIYSMTPKERSNPDLVSNSQSRRNRIAKGSGQPVQEINRMIKQFEQTRKMMKTMAGAKMPNLMGMGNMMRRK
jgi:signal recognition particle subunit SRP54